MGKITRALKGFLGVSATLVIMAVVAFIIIATVEKSQLTYREIKQFRGSLEAALEGDDRVARLQERYDYDQKQWAAERQEIMDKAVFLDGIDEDTAENFVAAIEETKRITAMEKKKSK